jgi:hypothetical protein
VQLAVPVISSNDVSGTNGVRRKSFDAAQKCSDCGDIFLRFVLAQIQSDCPEARGKSRQTFQNDAIGSKRPLYIESRMHHNLIKTSWNRITATGIRAVVS